MKPLDQGIKSQAKGIHSEFFPGFDSKADQEFSVFWGATGELYSQLLMPESHSTDGRYRTSRRPTSLLTNRLWEPLAWRGKSILSLSEPWLFFILFLLWVHVPLWVRWKQLGRPFAVFSDSIRLD